MRELPSQVLKQLNVDERATWQFMAGRKSITSAEIMEHLEFDERKVQRILKKLMTENLIHRFGKGRAIYYKVVQS
jgi:uncharacterized membrane protein